MENKKDKLISKKVAAERLDCSTKTIERMINDGQLARRPVRGVTKVPESQIDAIVNGTAA